MRHFSAKHRRQITYLAGHLLCAYEERHGHILDRVTMYWVMTDDTSSLKNSGAFVLQFLSSSVLLF